MPTAFKSYRDILGREIHCICGRRHFIPLKTIILGKGAIQKTSDILKDITENRYGLLLSDNNTHQIAGKYLADHLTALGFRLEYCILDGYPLVKPNEETLFEVLSALEPSMGFILAVGSGTINDIARFISYKTGKPYVIAATAPSMDGYASTVSPLLVKGFKRTYTATHPTAIIADTDILSKSPHEMVTAGFGDILGKLTSLADWRLAAVLTGEHWCPTAAGLMENAVQKVLIHTRNIANRNIEGIRTLMEALILSGISMMLAGNSRPASGCEHHISHYLEMKALINGTNPLLHGTKVGLATLYTTALYDILKQIDPTTLDIPKLLNKRQKYHEWKDQVIDIYGALSPEIISEKGTGDWDKDIYRARLERIKSLWLPSLLPIIQSVPSLSQVKRWIKESGSAFTPDDLGLEPRLIIESLLHAKEVRTRYTALSLASDIGLLNIELVYKIMALL